jgi:hypothetical protein
MCILPARQDSIIPVNYVAGALKFGKAGLCSCLLVTIFLFGELLVHILSFHPIPVGLCTACLPYRQGMFYRCGDMLRLES